MGTIWEGVQWLVDPGNWDGRNGIGRAVVQQLWYSFVATLAAALIGLPIGLAVGHTGRGRLVAANVAGVWRAIPTIGVSPAPIGATSGRLTRTTSIRGVSRNRGTRYSEKRGLVIRPLSKPSDSYSAPPRPITIEPSIWFLRCSGLMTAPHSNAAVTRVTRTLPVWWSTATSAHVPIQEFFSVPTAMP